MLGLPEMIDGGLNGWLAIRILEVFFAGVLIFACARQRVTYSPAPEDMPNMQPHQCGKDERQVKVEDLEGRHTLRPSDRILQRN